jgi:hypothetical protein
MIYQITAVRAPIGLAAASVPDQSGRAEKSIRVPIGRVRLGEGARLTAKWRTAGHARDLDVTNVTIDKSADRDLSARFGSFVVSSFASDNGAIACSPETNAR